MNAQVLLSPKPRFYIEEKSLGLFFFNNGKKYADKICQVDGNIDECETFASVRIRSIRVALALQKRGLTSNDVVAFCCPNILDNIIPIIATAYLGAKVANLEPSLSARHTKHVLELTTPRFIFVEENSLNLIEQSLEGTIFKTEIIVFGKSQKYTPFINYVQEDQNEEIFEPVDVDPEDMALMFFSSGTTGLPKAIVHSHHSIILIASYLHQYGFYGTILHFASLYWITAMGSFLCCFNTGDMRVFCRNPTASDIFRIIQKYKVQSMFMAPVLTYQLTGFEHAENFDTSSLQLVMVGGTPIAIPQFQKLKNLFKSAFVTKGYGMSEIGVVSAFDIETDRNVAETKPTSTGKPGPDLQMKVVDPNTRELLGPNEKGEICIICPSIMKGYYRGDVSQVFDEEGFLKTGDVGYYDEDGCVYVVERLKEMFKYKSWHIVPSSLEAVLLEHPSIKAVAVFGIPHEVDGDVPAACVVLNESSFLSEEEIDEFLKSRVADRERLRGGVTFRDALPQTPSGKIIRKEIRDLIIGAKRT